MGASDRNWVNAELATMFDRAATAGIPDDVLGRLLVEAAIGVWRRQRSVRDIADELQYMVDNLDPDIEYHFMRP